MTEETVQMIGYGRTVTVPVELIEQHKRYGWRFAVATQMTRSEILQMKKDELNDFAAKHLPHVDLDPEQQTKPDMQSAVLLELNLAH